MNSASRARANPAASSISIRAPAGTSSACPIRRETISLRLSGQRCFEHQKWSGATRNSYCKQESCPPRASLPHERHPQHDEGADPIRIDGLSWFRLCVIRPALCSTIAAIMTASIEPTEAACRCSNFQTGIEAHCPSHFNTTFAAAWLTKPAACSRLARIPSGQVAM